jgi:hypothetical protein
MKLTAFFLSGNKFCGSSRLFTLRLCDRQSKTVESDLFTKSKILDSVFQLHQFEKLATGWKLAFPNMISANVAIRTYVQQGTVGHLPREFSCFK